MILVEVNIIRGSIQFHLEVIIVRALFIFIQRCYYSRNIIFDVIIDDVITRLLMDQTNE